MQRQTVHPVLYPVLAGQIILQYLLHQVTCHSHRQTEGARLCLLSMVWTPLALHNLSRRAPYRHLPYLTVTVLHRQTLTVLLHPFHQTFPASHKACHPVCHLFPQACHLQASQASLLRLVVWLLRHQDGRALLHRHNSNKEDR